MDHKVNQAQGESDRAEGIARAFGMESVGPTHTRVLLTKPHPQILPFLNFHSPMLFMTSHESTFVLISFRSFSKHLIVPTSCIYRSPEGGSATKSFMILQWNLSMVLSLKEPNVWYVVSPLVLLVIAGWLVMNYVSGNDFNGSESLIFTIWFKMTYFCCLNCCFTLKKHASIISLLHFFWHYQHCFFLDVSLLFVHLLKSCLITNQQWNPTTLQKENNKNNTNRKM